MQTPGKTRRSGNFWYLFAGLLFVLLALPFMSVLPSIGHYSVILIFNLSMLISVWSMSASRRIFHIGILLVAAIFVITAIKVFGGHQILEPLRFLLVLIFDILSCLIAARNVFVLHRADLNSLVGAFCVYLLLGLIWAIMYQLLHLFGWATFSGSLGDGQPLFPALTYFSFVTLAGLGYGDIVPVGAFVRTFAYLEAVIGQFYLAVMVATLVGNYSSRRTNGRSSGMENNYEEKN